MKALSPISITEEGIEICSNFEHSKKKSKLLNFVIVEEIEILDKEVQP